MRTSSTDGKDIQLVGRTCPTTKTEGITIPLRYTPREPHMINVDTSTGFVSKD